MLFNRYGAPPRALAPPVNYQPGGCPRGMVKGLVQAYSRPGAPQQWVGGCVPVAVAQAQQAQAGQTIGGNYGDPPIRLTNAGVPRRNLGRAVSLKFHGMSASFGDDQSDLPPWLQTSDIDYSTGGGSSDGGGGGFTPAPGDTVTTGGADFNANLQPPPGTDWLSNIGTAAGGFLTGILKGFGTQPVPQGQLPAQQAGFGGLSPTTLLLGAGLLGAAIYFSRKK